MTEKFNTDVRMLPQFGPLEGKAVDKPCAKPIETFLADRPAVLAGIRAPAKLPLKDAAAVNATRWALFGALKAFRLPVEVGSGRFTKWNWSRLSIAKSHALDLARVGRLETIAAWDVPVLNVKGTGRGIYQRARLDPYGFPRRYCMRRKIVHGFQTGDMVRADVSCGKKAGIHVGRVAVRLSGSFNVQTPTGIVQGIYARNCTCRHSAEGYGYQQNKEARSLPRLKAGVSARSTE